MLATRSRVHQIADVSLTTLRAGFYMCVAWTTSNGSGLTSRRTLIPGSGGCGHAGDKA